MFQLRKQFEGEVILFDLFWHTQSYRKHSVYHSSKKKKKTLYPLESTADCLLLVHVHGVRQCMCVCCIRGNPFGKRANLSIWTSVFFYLLCQFLLTVYSCSSFSLTTGPGAARSQEADGLHMIRFSLSLPHAWETCVKKNPTKSVMFNVFSAHFLLSLALSLTHKHSGILFYPRPGGGN